MKQNNLRNMLQASLNKLYEMGVVENLAEFWQGELHVLEYLYQHSDSEIIPSVLSDALGVSRARITAALSALRKKEYVTMEMCEHDRRRMRVLLTNKGKQFIEEKQREVEKQFDILINGLGEKNVLELIRLTELSKEILGNENVG
jgi:DNA-binding MarR family transcriptional regulator